MGNRVATGEIKMTSRERLLAALNNERPDRLPCQVHGWMQYYLDTYLYGCDWYEAYGQFDMNYAIYVNPTYQFAEKDLASWQIQRSAPVKDNDGNTTWRETIITPRGELTQVFGQNQFTLWNTEHLLKTEKDIELWKEFAPVPVAADLSPVQEAYDKLGDRGIIRSHPYYPGQGSPWQALCILMGTEKGIYLAMDEPEQTHDLLETMTPKAMGGDCDLAEASRRVGDQLFFIGGFDQNAGFEKGTPEVVRRQVFDCFEATKDHAGYIIAPSDHFFFGDPENLQVFSDAIKACVY